MIWHRFQLHISAYNVVEMSSHCSSLYVNCESSIYYRRKKKSPLCVVTKCQTYKYKVIIKGYREMLSIDRPCNCKKSSRIFVHLRMKMIFLPRFHFVSFLLASIYVTLLILSEVHTILWRWRVYLEMKESYIKRMNSVGTTNVWSVACTLTKRIWYLPDNKCK